MSAKMKGVMKNRITAIFKNSKIIYFMIHLEFFETLTFFMMKAFDVIQAKFFWTLVDKRMFEFSFVHYQAFILDYQIRSMIG